MLATVESKAQLQLEERILFLVHADSISAISIIVSLSNDSNIGLRHELHTILPINQNNCYLECSSFIHFNGRGYILLSIVALAFMLFDF